MSQDNSEVEVAIEDTVEAMSAPLDATLDATAAVTTIDEAAAVPVEPNPINGGDDDDTADDPPAPLPIVEAKSSSGTDDDEPSAQPAVNPDTPATNTAVTNNSNNEEEKEGAETTTINNDDATNLAAELKRTPEEAREAFVNEGLILWEAARQEWLGVRGRGGGSSSSGSSSSTSARPTAVPLDVDKIIDVLFYASTREARVSNGPPEKFPRNVPLPQMVDILYVFCWLRWQCKVGDIIFDVII